ncbi:hypothetical protein [uncultured Tateyamaria sp.]|uniref:hypothetical protein n=1 Tax=uncultured Tateyamaria sp. TaxID=455651 RepID=UPI002616D5D2|nr:hypothetical protein [uncultured Tateyamaria sp.]
MARFDLPRRVLCALVLFCALTPLRASAEAVTMWVYHNFPPFVVDAEARSGMSFALADMLTERSGGQYVFNVVVLPRQRLNDQLRAGDAGVVLWGSPLWFGDADRSRYLWTSALVEDRNDVISPRAAPVAYDGPGSLDGSTVVGVKGHRYPGVDERVTAGNAARLDVSSEAALVQFIANGRGSVGIVAHSAAAYFVHAYALEDRVHIAPAPHSTYERYIMVQPELAAVHGFIEDVWPSLAGPPC